MFTKNKILSTDLSTSIPQRRSIFAIFVHYGASEITNTATASLKTGTASPDYIIIVDHADIVMPGRNDNAIIIRPKINTGYAGGLQSGIAEAVRLGAKETDLCILLNNDITFTRDSLQRIATWWEKHGGPQVLAGAAGGYVSLFSGRAHITNQIKTANSWQVTYIHGSCMIAEFGLYSSVSFPASFFMYWEDVAISMMVVRRGGKLMAIPGLQNIHDDTDGVTSSSKLYYMVRNGAYVLEHYLSLSWRLYWYALNTIRMAYHAVHSTNQHKIVARALRDARRGRLGRVNL
ncbi:MAG: hypothetical protein O3A36_00365 [bacterium]|nr:hypothetical protein [bacterium]